MRFLALATDFDGTIAWHGNVADPTIAALQRLKDSGRKIILVTGRELPDLLKVFPTLNIFDYVIAENGALLYHPARKQSRVLATPPPRQFVDLLRERGVHPLSLGRVIVATHESYKEVVQRAIKELNLGLQVILNKGDVMILPANVDKATGLQAALTELHIPPVATVAVGDAENDFAFLRISGCTVAVANALDSLKQRAQFVTKAGHGTGVEELIEMILANDLACALH
ncbi:HAD family hydrolase [Pedosphaera parvula]|uniref:HAD-superfamily hydrolase, subfamily IIB n=1 Tax=Pedosphaera parvula (strain Ellin514) TaxID=320771 RepID=B9XSP5_PEDPL|nr:HAD family hydrolase [Pedosphaera parvula]EEF57130.1 HAD-superfamily hydrolase, subfamily IIB [Pedosphaera parvula Ellin514]